MINVTVMDIEDRFDQLEKRIERLEDEKEKLKDKINSEEKSEKEEVKNTKISRREFLKKAGLGTAGLAAMSLLTNASALDIKSGQGLQVYQSGTEYLDITSSSVKITGTDLNVVKTSGQEVIQVPVYQDTSNLPSKSEGSIAYVKNDNKLYIQDSN